MAALGKSIMVEMCHNKQFKEMLTGTENLDFILKVIRDNGKQNKEPSLDKEDFNTPGKAAVKISLKDMMWKSFKRK